MDDFKTFASLHKEEMKTQTLYELTKQLPEKICLHEILLVEQ